VAAAALVAETVLVVEVEPAAAVEVSLAPVALAELEPVAAAVAVPLAAQAGVVFVLAVAPVLAPGVVEYRGSEPPSVVAGSQVAPQ
jgi:hypothetical protein